MYIEELYKCLNDALGRVKQNDGMFIRWGGAGTCLRTDAMNTSSDMVYNVIRDSS